MDPSIPSINSGPPQSPPSSFGSDPEPVIARRKSRKKLFIIVGVILTVLIIAGVGLSVWATINRNNQLAAEARLEAAEQAKARALAKAREGTLSDLKKVLDTEQKKTQELNDRFVYAANDNLKQEAETAATIGTGNENGL